MNLMKTIGSVAAASALAVTLLIAPSANAAAPTAAVAAPASISVKTAGVSHCSNPKAQTKTTAAGPKLAPSGYFAVAVTGSFRSGQVSNCRLLSFGTAYTHKPFTTKVSGDLKFGTKSTSANYAFVKPGNNKVVAEIYYFPTSQRSKVLASLDSWEGITKGKKWYKRDKIRYTWKYASPANKILVPVYAEMYFAGSGYKPLIKGSECRVKDGDYKRRFVKGNGCR